MNAWHEMRAQPRQRIAFAVGGNFGIGSIAALIVRTRVAVQPRHGEPHERGTVAAPNVIDAFRQQRRRFGGIRSVAVAHEQVPERCEVSRDVAARRLHVAADRNPESVVLDVEQDGKRQRRGHRERRPKPVRRHRAFAAEPDTDRARPTRVAENVGVIANRLRPAGARSELRAHVAGHRQHDGAVPIRQVAYDADIATVAEAAGSPERTGQRVFDAEPEREEQRPRPIVGACRVVRVRQQRTENGLRDVVSPRRELIEHEVFTRHVRAVLVRRLFDVVEGARYERVVCDPAPVEARIGRVEPSPEPGARRPFVARVRGPRGAGTVVTSRNLAPREQRVEARKRRGPGRERASFHAK